MSKKDDMENKIGRQGLSSLLNKKQPEPEPRSAFEYDDVPSMSGGAQRYPGGYSGGYHGRGGRYNGPRAFNGSDLGSPVGGRRKPTRAIPYIEESGSRSALIDEKILRRLANDAMVGMEDKLRNHGVHWALSADSLVRECVIEMILSCDFRIRNGNGVALTLRIDDGSFAAQDDMFDD